MSKQREQYSTHKEEKRGRREREREREKARCKSEGLRENQICWSVRSWKAMMVLKSLKVTIGKWELYSKDNRKPSGGFKCYHPFATTIPRRPVLPLLLLNSCLPGSISKSGESRSDRHHWGHTPRSEPGGCGKGVFEKADACCSASLVERALSPARTHEMRTFPQIYRNGVQIVGGQNMTKFHYAWNPFHMQHWDYST